PSVSREIEAAHERNRIVHDDELLVMRRAGRMPVVELEVQTPLRARGKPELGQPFALESKKKRKIPAQNVCGEVRTRGEKRGQEIAQRLRKTVVRSVGGEPHATIDVPTGDEDGALALRERGTHRAEIVGAVDEP